MKISSHTIGNRTRDLPACVAQCLNQFLYRVPPIINSVTQNCIVIYGPPPFTGVSSYRNAAYLKAQSHNKGVKYKMQENTNRCTALQYSFFYN